MFLIYVQYRQLKISTSLYPPGLGAEYQAMTQFVDGVDQIVQSPRQPTDPITGATMATSMEEESGRSEGQMETSGSDRTSSAVGDDPVGWVQNLLSDSPATINVKINKH